MRFVQTKYLPHSNIKYLNLRLHLKVDRNLLHSMRQGAGVEYKSGNTQQGMVK